MSQFQGFGSLVHPIRMIGDVLLCQTSLCTNTVCSYTHFLHLNKKQSTFDFPTTIGTINAFYGTQYLK